MFIFSKWHSKTSNNLVKFEYLLISIEQLLELFDETFPEILLIPKKIGKCIFITWFFAQNSGSILYSGDDGVSELKRDSLFTGRGGVVGIPLDNVYEGTLMEMFMINS